MRGRDMAHLRRVAALGRGMPESSVSEVAEPLLDVVPSLGQSVSDGSKRYDVLMELGRGGAAVVHAAMARGPGGFSKLVVLKTIRAELMDAPDTVKMFLREARLSARMNHPNVVQVYEVYEDQGLPVIVMEYLDGQSLAAFLPRYFADPGYDVRVPLSLLCKALEGLHHAHSLTDFDGRPLKLVHRDVTPHNVLVMYDGQVKLLDFGIAKLDVASETRTGTIKGKLGYMSRQQVDGSELDCRTDVFAMGVMIWEVTARQRMWHGVSEAVVLKRLLCNELPSLREVVADADPELERICQRALAPDPAQRYSDAQELLGALQGWLLKHGGVVPGPALGELVSRTCADARRKFQQRLDAELRRFSTGPDHNWTEASSTLTAAAAPAPAPAPAPRASGRWAERRDTGTSTAYTDQVRPVDTRGGSRGAWLLALVALATALVAAWPAIMSTYARSVPTSLEPPSPPAVAAAVVQQGQPPAEPPEARTIRISIAAHPSHAAVYLDGVRVASNPFSATLPIDAKLHELRVEAPGFEPLTRELHLDADQEFDVALATRSPEHVESAPPDKVRKAPTTTREKRSGARSRNRSAMRGERGRAAEKRTPSTRSSSSAVADRCDPPYTVDPLGIKRYRRECL
jgi:serine/threonine-protein kinase